MRILKELGLFALLLPAGFAQSQPNAADILKKVGEAYKSASQYEFIADVTGARTSGQMLFAFKSPDRYRFEGTFPDSVDLEEGGIIVDDGSTVWLYQPQSNQYLSFPASSLAADIPFLNVLRPETMRDSMNFLEAVTFAKDAKLLREETIEVAGVQVNCFVVTVPYSQAPRGASRTGVLWVDKKAYRVMREDSGDTSMVFTSIKLDENLPDDLFKFVPPLGANKVETQVEPRRVPRPPPPR
jgi:outer membrane lipoprotein-sorting protein